MWELQYFQQDVFFISIGFTSADSDPLTLYKQESISPPSPGSQSSLSEQKRLPSCLDLSDGAGVPLSVASRYHLKVAEPIISRLLSPTADVHLSSHRETKNQPFLWTHRTIFLNFLTWTTTELLEDSVSIILNGKIFAAEQTLIIQLFLNQRGRCFQGVRSRPALYKPSPVQPPHHYKQY